MQILKVGNRLARYSNCSTGRTTE